MKWIFEMNKTQRKIAEQFGYCGLFAERSTIQEAYDDMIKALDKKTDNMYLFSLFHVFCNTVAKYFATGNIIKDLGLGVVNIEELSDLTNAKVGDTVYVLKKTKIKEIYPDSQYSIKIEYSRYTSEGKVWSNAVPTVFTQNPHCILRRNNEIKHHKKEA